MSCGRAPTGFTGDPVRALDRKLLRDLWHLKTQAAAIALVIGTGVTMFAMYLSTFDSLAATQSSYYDRFRFADVFAGLERAPLAHGARIRAISGVTQAETRVVVDVTLDVAGLGEPATGRLVSIPDRDVDTLNDVFLRRGRYIASGAHDEILVHEAFATEHALVPGDRVAAIINGRRRELHIVGIALSPEYVYVIGPGSILPDNRHFGIFWMERRSLAAAFDMEGGFNHVSLRLSPDASEEAVIVELDRLLEPYGGRGAIPRSLQTSHWYLDNELHELRTMAGVLPMIFLGVAAFLVHIVLSRMIAVQRSQIAVLKAIGYTNRRVALHYLGIGATIGVVGALLGNVAGARLGLGMTRIYIEYFRFPVFLYGLAPDVALSASTVSLAAAGLGTVFAVRRAVALPPAEAMRPEPPARFRHTRLERLGARQLLGVSGRMVLRNVAQRPWRFGLSALGVGMAIALLILVLFFVDALDEMLTNQFEVMQRHDVSVSFSLPRSSRARFELARLPGVLQVEPFRMVPVRLRHQNRTRYGSILGLPAVQTLNRVIDRRSGAITLPKDGIVMSSQLAEIVGVAVGDRLAVEVLEGARPRRLVTVTGLVDDYLGLSTYMEVGSLGRLQREDETLSGAFLTVDPLAEAALYRTLKNTPGVAGVTLTKAAIRSFRETFRENLMRMILFSLGFSSIIAGAVVYNAARISLSERERDLASLRVLGFNRREIARILFGELTLVVLAAIPLGVACGYGLAWLTLALLHNELYRIPLTIAPATYGVAVLGVVLAAVLSAVLVRRRLDRLNLVAVLKTRD